MRRQNLKGSNILRRLNIKEIGGGVKESECLSSFLKLYEKRSFEMKIGMNPKYFAINTVATGMIWLMRKLQEAAVRS